jgi:hypothetical protein
MAINPSGPRTLSPHLDWAICDRARLARDRAFDGVLLGCSFDPRLLPPSMPCASRTLGECHVLPNGCSRRTRGISSLPALPARSGSRFPSLGRHSVDRGARDAHDRRGLPRSTLCRGTGDDAWCRAAPSPPPVLASHRRDAKRDRCDETGAESKAPHR